MSASPDVNSSDLGRESNLNHSRSSDKICAPQKHRPLNHCVAIAIADYYGPAQLS